MPEELRVFVRAGLYVALTTAIYWFVSYEKAGTLLLVFLFLAMTAVIGAGLVLGRRAERAGPSLLRRAWSAVALDEAGEGPAPLEVEEEPVVTASPWPFVGALAAMLIGLGLLYGPWLWIPGAGLALSVAYGWITQTDA